MCFFRYPQKRYRGERERDRKTENHINKIQDIKPIKLDDFLREVAAAGGLNSTSEAQDILEKIGIKLGELLVDSQMQ